MMSQREIDLDPVSRITFDAIGQPGQRVFYLQAYQDDQVITLLVEKFQIQTLVLGVEQFLEEIAQRSPYLSLVSDFYDESQMHIIPPVDPLFRVGDFGLGYDVERDRVIFAARELVDESAAPEQGREIRFWITRSQLRVLSLWGAEVAAKGRQICPYCGEPMDPQGHFCVKKNGHKH